MIKQFAGTITSFLIHDYIIKEEDREIYQYGTEQIIINLIALAVVCIIAFSTNSWKQVIFWLSGMLPIRVVAGGYHASTPVRCNLLTVTIFLLNMIVINVLKKHMIPIILRCFICIIFISIMFFAPVDHKNKVLEQNEYLIAKRKSRIMGIAIVVLCLALSIILGVRNVILTSTIMGAFTASVSLIIGSIKRGGEKDENDECNS